MVIKMFCINISINKHMLCVDVSHFIEISCFKLQLHLKTFPCTFLLQIFFLLTLGKLYATSMTVLTFHFVQTKLSSVDWTEFFL